MGVKKTGKPMLDGIGSHRNAAYLHYQSLRRHGAGFTSRPVSGYQAMVVDDDMKEVPRGAPPASLAVRGPTGCRYLARRPARKAYVRDGWNLTGDTFVQRRGRPVLLSPPAPTT